MYKNISKNGSVYYYQHADDVNNNTETACYYCAVNKANYTKTTNSQIAYLQQKSYNEALARERYYQKEDIKTDIFTNIQIFVTKKRLSIENKDIFFILDESASMRSEIGHVRTATINILNSMLSEGNSDNFYIGFIRFSSAAYEMGTLRNQAGLSELIEKINMNYRNREWKYKLLCCIFISNTNDKKRFIK